MTVNREKKCRECVATINAPARLCADCRSKCAGRSSLAWKARNLEKYKETQRNRNQTLRQLAISAYGKVCACCGESEYCFLAIDHIDNGGNEHRRSIKSSNIFYWLKQNNYPPGFQVLCHNCNCAKAFYKKCPNNN